MTESVRLFLKEGYEAVTVEQIATAVGIKAPSLYKHYKSKKDIFESILDRMNQMDYERAKEYEMPKVTMDDKYKKAIKNENNIYKEMMKTIAIPKQCSIGINELDRALDWLCLNSETILDFGCGNGTMLFLCARRGAKKLFGIDLAVEGINCAKLRQEMMNEEEYNFTAGSIDALQMIGNEEIDGIILSNILDNMYPVDVSLLLEECTRVLKKHGKVLVKLNPFITQNQIVEWKMEKIEKDVYDDGFILWNRSTEEWKRQLEEKFIIVEAYEFEISETEQINRIILLEKM